MNSTTCCACAAKFGKEVEGNPCTICEKVFCTSCCALKSKLEMTASRRGRRSCVCQRLIDTSKNYHCYSFICCLAHLDIGINNVQIYSPTCQ
ncbi:hypothetical protein DPMN_127679 [Dreissena polymorpha]|uniref:Uncharacterized protein n=1 Tax=Dreissena polymorpha TaxID=45954 RepID=A0A9D4H5P8_DREPO|nr:hypothetical protein DPMN_127679 [Dreissena polymorpha]